MPVDWLGIGVWIGVIELAGGLVIAGFAAVALVRLARNGIDAARLTVIEGTLAGLGLKTAATLLKTIEVHDWAQIGTFAAILALRTLVKQVLVWEQSRLARR